MDTPDDPVGNPGQGHPGQDLLWPGEFVLGYATQKPKAANADGDLNTEPGDDSKSGPAWTRDGSYLVFRRLRQDVRGFEREVEGLAKQLGLSVDLMGAKLVGRYKSGAPIEQRKFQPGPYTPPSTDPGRPFDGNPELGNNDTLNNNFEFRDNDARGSVCPVAAHIRKAYPRDEVTPAGPADSESSTQTRRILRRGIPYGPSFVRYDPDSAKIDRGNTGQAAGGAAWPFCRHDGREDPALICCCKVIIFSPGSLAAGMLIGLSGVPMARTRLALAFGL